MPVFGGVAAHRHRQCAQSAVEADIEFIGQKTAFGKTHPPAGRVEIHAPGGVVQIDPLDIGMAVIRSLSTELLTIARPICDKLRDAFGETVALELWSGDSTVQAYNAPSSNPVSVLLGLRSHGDKYPAHVAAGAKSPRGAILAFSPAELVDQVIKGKLQRFTPNTITEPGLFKEHLKEIRKTGIAVDNGEFHMEVRAIGAPIFNAHKEPVAGLVIAAPFYRANVLMQAATMERLKEAALAISTQLQYSGETEDRGNTPAV